MREDSAVARGRQTVFSCCCCSCWRADVPAMVLSDKNHKSLLVSCLREIFHWKNWAFFATFFRMLYITFYGFYRWDVAGRPPANSSSSRSSSRSRKKFGGPQLQQNRRAQLRLASPARTHGTNETKRFPGWSHPPNLRYICECSQSCCLWQCA